MTKFYRNQLVTLVFRHLAAPLIVLLTTLVLRRVQPFLAVQIIVLIYLLPVMVSTVLWGLTPGLLAGFFAFFAFNYYFIQPFHTLEVHATQDVILLIIFLIVAVVISQLIGQAREGVRAARIREWEATRMYELTSTLAGLQDLQSIAQVLARQIYETFQSDYVSVSIGSKNREPSLTVSIPENMPQPDGDFIRIEMITARGLEGELKLRPHIARLSPEEVRLLEAFSSQGALSIERIRLTAGENKARVLEESDRLKSSLLSSVSHELRSPLAAIKASVSSLRSGTIDWDTSAREDLLATIEEETDQLNLLVGNLLDMSRIESGALQPMKRWSSISEIAMGVVIKMQKHLHDHHLEMDMPDDLPLVPVDYVMLGQVFTNLLSNSIKYAPANTAISISGKKNGGDLHVVVANEGPPVPEEHLKRIFDKFYRITEAERVTGTGLGLSICKGIIEAHGGKIWAENEPRRFVFHFTLPLTLDGSLPDFPKEAGDE